MRDSQERAREDRVRRMAKRRGLMLKKSRRRNPDAIDYGLYWIIEPGRNFVVAHGSRCDHGMNLDEVEAHLVANVAGS